MKRKNETPANGVSKKRALSDKEAKTKFRDGLFDTKVLEEYRKKYAKSKPYLHGVITDLINPSLLRSVRDEIREHISFTPKETDIYKIHQSGDLANLDGLDDAALARFPSLLTLRDAMYSSAFRKYISTVANSGPLSGKKTDMAINVYTPGCHLLCHDDVIGSRRVSYILYLLDPDRPWKAEWGGALRLFPTETLEAKGGEKVKVPMPDPTVVIPPQFNQLSFFTVQPGESFHDVEEVYRRRVGEIEDDGGRVRMAISGWFHIPQEGEEGYEEGLEEKLAERSSLQQLQGGKADEFDAPQPKWRDYPEDETKQNGEDEDEEPELSEEDLDFLIKFMTPNYLTPETVEELRELFTEESSLRLANFLSKKFSARLRTFIEDVEANSDKNNTIPGPKQNVGVARPPHKHRFLFRQPGDAKAKGEPTPYDELVDTFFPSLAFHKWLSLATGLTLAQSNILARRFRRGMDYTLATTYEKEDPQLEICLGITPTKGWGGEEEVGSLPQEQLEEKEEEEQSSKKKKKSKKNKKQPSPPPAEEDAENIPGGYEMYMAGDDDDDDGDDDDDAGSDHGVEIKPGTNTTNASSNTGAGKRRSTKADPAIYRGGNEGEDDAPLFSMGAGWNMMSVVLRDTGVLRFVKYVSGGARGDRWDVCGEFGVEVGDEDDEEGEDGEADAILSMAIYQCSEQRLAPS
ncbi:hypothetical protein K490DRAFT_74993 [Saccharata proteae CBS 121410]|uniref:uS12 prolyl 3,4-dihydroxylase n=1 Tax=Saccharata proteae CBS 121410 TaxID=1314787 RepID=A0A9P4HTE3_9PEZI|nr:hypothetical protein K490DRAFT_74993 [Saccharata proteae CBS 121410]